MRHRPLWTYSITKLLVFAGVAALGIVYQRDLAEDEARRAAVAAARFGAQVAARDVSSAADLARTTVASSAASPAVAAVFEAPAGCTLTFAGAGGFRSGHLDIVGRDGSVVCSSRPTPANGYAGAEWLTAALERPTFAGPLVDDRTGKQVMVATAPIGDRGLMAAFLELDALGPGLAATASGPHRLEFLVTTADGRTSLTRSVEPSRWTVADLTDTPFARDGGVERRDVDGARRFYGQANVEGLGWKVFAGAERSQTMAAADRFNRRELATTVLGLLVLLVAVSIVNRRITKPLARLSTGLRTATNDLGAEPLEVTGPAEVARLAEDCNTLLDTARRELATASHLAAIVECSDDAIVSLTSSGVILSWNPAAERMFGWSAEEMVGQDTSRLLPADEPPSRPSLVEQVATGRQVGDYEARLRIRNGDLVDVSVTASPISDSSGAVVGIAAVARDVTERNRAERERRALEHRLEQAARLESVGRLAGGVAHDFNNLLSVIGNSADFVAERVDDETIRHDVEQIRSAVERAVQLTRQLLIFGRRETVKPELLDLNAVVADIQTLLARTLGEHVQQVVRVDFGLPAIRADRGHVEQILVNLAVNARDAMPDGGTLTIETHVVEPADEIRYVELTVTDTGTGMSPDVAARVFEPFFTTKPQGSGTGLGLATVYGIVTEAGGRVTVESRLGEGTTFHVQLPAVDAPRPATRRARAEPIEQGRGETILVVEDEPALLEVTARMLRRRNYVVLTAASYEEALSLAAEHDFHLLLTDSVIPRMPGRELAERIRGLRPGRPVLFMSGYSDGVLTARRGLDAGVSFLQKPFNEQALLEAVRAALQGKRARSSWGVPTKRSNSDSK